MELRITEVDFMLANRRAIRLEEIAEHGHPIYCYAIPAVVAVFIATFALYGSLMYS